LKNSVLSNSLMIASETLSSQMEAAMANLNLLNLTPNGVQHISQAASKHLFGANLLFNRDGGWTPASIDQPYQEFAREVGLSTIRYPGGTITESQFDMSNPNAIGQAQNGIKDNVPLSNFLAYTASIGATATIVVPTYRLFTDKIDRKGQHIIDESLETMVHQFVQFVLSEAKRLGTKVSAFELGNEWWVDNSDTFGFRMSPIEYGRVANFLARVVEEAVVDYNDSVAQDDRADPDIAVQIGPGGNSEWYRRAELGLPSSNSGPYISATEVIFQQISDPVSRAAIDATLTHRYLTGSDEAISGWAYNPFLYWDTLARNTPGFRVDPNRYVTEWNVSSLNTAEHGLKQFDSLVLLVEEMLLSGIDHANVWAVQQNNNTRMIYNSGLKNQEYSGLTFGGLAFDMMSKHLPGLKVVLQPGNLQGLDTIVFGSNERMVYFLSNRSEMARADLLSLSTLPSGSHHFTIYEINEGSDSRPTVTITTIGSFDSVTFQRLNFGTNSSVMIVVALQSSGTHIEGYDQTDSLSGSQTDDTIQGGGGDDTLRGEGRNDSLDGESGDDSLCGDWGHDTLKGGDGSDQLFGGAGNDVLYGGRGSDTISGGSGQDLVNYSDHNANLLTDLGTSQKASLSSGDGIYFAAEDFCAGFGNDTVCGGNSANTIAGGHGGDSSLGFFGDDTLSGEAGAAFSDGATGEDYIEGGAGPDCLFGGDGSDRVIGGDDDDLVLGGLGFDVLEGGSGDDSISGNEDVDVLLGGLGDDSLDGGSAGDRVFGGSGIDTLWGGDGADALDGGEGDDWVYGGIGADYIIGMTGEDTLLGDAGADKMRGGAGRDSVFGGSGQDTIFGSDGDDYMFGDDDDDLIFGDRGNDLLVGGAGNDSLISGGGDDILQGDIRIDGASDTSGRDVFIFQFGLGSTRVLDFEDDVDVLVFDAHLSRGMSSAQEFVDSYGSLQNGYATFDFGKDSKIVINNVSSLTNLYDDMILIF
jgi:Ca2+-binding RTX toxin-like protein